jgi:hypothetical protein
MSLPYQRHSDTSMEAAVAAELRHDNERSRVLQFLIERGGATDDEIQVALGMNPSTERPRRIELVNRGLVRDTGRTWPTRTGRRATVWEVVR